MRWMPTLAAGLAALVLLTGCVPTRALPAGPSEAELQRVITSNIEASWRSMGLDDSLRPPDPPIEYVGIEEWPIAVTECMTEIGYESYFMDTNGAMVVGEYWIDQAESLDWFLCQARTQYHPELYGLLSTAQLDYLYDYNLTVLVPCLEAHGVAIESAPTRAQALEFGGEYWGWTPYFALPEGFDSWANPADRHTREACPPFPPDPAFDEMRERV